MKVNEAYLIPFIGLKLGKHRFDYQINKTFFDEFSNVDFDNCLIDVVVNLEKKSTFLEINFKHKGTVYVPCDLTNENFNLPIKGKLKLVVKFGEQFNDENEELLILPHGEHQIDIKQYIYEMIVLSIPQKRIHPGVKEGTLHSETLEKLKEFSIKEKTKDTFQDPRWDKLKQLLTDKDK